MIKRKAENEKFNQNPTNHHNTQDKKTSARSPQKKEEKNKYNGIEIN